MEAFFSIALTCSCCFASFSSNLDTLAKKMAIELQLSPQRPLSITSFDIDENYILPIRPIWLELKEKLAPYAKTVTFNPFRGNRSTEKIIEAPEYGPISTPELKIDSLQLKGYCRIRKNDSSKINFKIKVVDINDLLIYESKEFIITIADCPPETEADIFDPLTNSDSFRELQYKGFLIKELDDLFNTPGNNLRAAPRTYRFEKHNQNALNWQVEQLRDILSRRYYLTISNTSSNVIAIEQSGSVIFSREGKRYSRANLVQGESAWPESYPDAHASYIFSNSSSQSSEETTFESRKFTTVPEITMRDTIFKIFDTYYPELFNNFNYQKLNEIFFSEKGNSTILTGTKLVDDPTSGREEISYRWRTKTDWLDSLKKSIEVRNRRFCIKTSIMQIFNDKTDENRYWAIVRQKWQTKDLLTGNVVYQDDGFLLVNFDFNAEDNKLKDFKIYYRLWFYDYKYDDLERGVKRYEKLASDIRTAFFGKNAIGSIDSTLKKRMTDFLISTVKNASIQKVKVR